MSKQLKQHITNDLKKRIGLLASYILVDYRGLNSAQSFDLRRVLHEAKVRMNVVPNRLALRILDRWKGAREEFRKFFRGPTAILFGDDGAVSASRVVMQWRKKNKNLLGIKGGVLEGEIIAPAAVEGLSKIPDRPVLLARVAGTFQAPLSRLAMATQQLVGRVAYALDARRKKLEEAGGGAAAEGPAEGPAAVEGPAAGSAEGPAAGSAGTAGTGEGQPQSGGPAA